MRITASQLFKEAEQGKWYPLILVAGDEPFQTQEILSQIKKIFSAKYNGDFSLECFDGEGLSASDLLSSLNQMPGLFDSLDGGSQRLVICQRLDKASAPELEQLAPYWNSPNPGTCFLYQCTKADKRKAYFRQAEAQGAYISLEDPSYRDWPKWKGYFEKKLGKKISADAFEWMGEATQRSLCITWTELQKAAAFVGEADTLSLDAMKALVAHSLDADVFSFVEDVLCRRKQAAHLKGFYLHLAGEAEPKLLALLVRQFRLVEQLIQRKTSEGVCQALGIPPFALQKLQQQCKFHTLQNVGETLTLLADCDYKVKTGRGSFLVDFLVPYLA